jgi:hypothetical protein
MSSTSPEKQDLSDTTERRVDDQTPHGFEQGRHIFVELRNIQERLDELEKRSSELTRPLLPSAANE